MKRVTSLLIVFLVMLTVFNCEKSPVNSEPDNVPETQPNLLGYQEINKAIPSALDTVNGTSEQTRQGGVYVFIVRDIVFTNPFIGVPLLVTLQAPVQHPRPGTWIWEKQIFQATHTLTGEWDGSGGYNWSYVWDGGNFQDYLALDGHTDIPGLNGNYTMYYNDANHSTYGTKTWSVDSDTTLTIDWVRVKYDPLNVPRREYLAHFRTDKSGDLTFWENEVKRFYIEWYSDGSGFWDLWTAQGNHIHGTF